MAYHEKPVMLGPDDELGLAPCLSEDWLLENLPDGWTYDCQVFGDGSPAGGPGFVIWSRDQPNRQLFLPLSLLADERHA